MSGQGLGSHGCWKWLERAEGVKAFYVVVEPPQADVSAPDETGTWGNFSFFGGTEMKRRTEKKDRPKFYFKRNLDLLIENINYSFSLLSDKLLLQARYKP